MKILFIDRKTGEMRLHIGDINDMWHLERVLSPGDFIEANTWRTHKVGTREEKKAVKLRISLERAEFSKHSNRLRLLGKIVWGEPEEFVQLGRHHSIDVSEDEKIKVIKSWKK